MAKQITYGNDSRQAVLRGGCRDLLGIGRGDGQGFGEMLGALFRDGGGR